MTIIYLYLISAVNTRMYLGCSRGGREGPRFADLMALVWPLTMIILGLILVFDPPTDDQNSDQEGD
jgi:hypothetical protein